MLKAKILKRALSRCLSIFLVFVFTGASNILAVTNSNDFTLSPPLATKPPCEMLPKADGSFDIVVDNGEALGRSFRTRWEYVKDTLTGDADKAFDIVYTFDNGKARLIPDKEVTILKEGDSSFDDMLTKLCPSSMFIETHPDDFAIHVGCTAQAIARHARGNKSLPLFVTAVPDQYGVSDAFCNSLNGQVPKDVRSRGNVAIKRWVRSHEAEVFAERIGFNEHYLNLDMDFPALNAVYNNGRFLPYQSTFQKPTEIDKETVERMIRENPVDSYFMVAPFSNHPHHRIVTQLFLDAIYKYNRKATIYLWANKEEFDRWKLRANVYLMYTKDTEDKKELAIAESFMSQNSRYNGDGKWYCHVTRNMSTIAREEISDIFGWTVSGNGVYPYADRLIKVRFEDVLDSSTKTPTADSESVSTLRLADAIGYIKANNQPFIIALGTSWIKGYEKGKYLQYNALNPLISSIRTYCESKGIPFIVGEDDKLLSLINAERAKEGKTNAKVVVLAGESTVKSDEFSALRSDEKNAFVVGVDNQELTEDSYIRLMEMLTIAIKLSAGLEVAQDSNAIIIKKDTEHNIYIFIPHSEPMNYEELRTIYNVQKFA